MATNTNPFYTYSATAGSSKTLQKPQDGGDNNQWGNYINTDLDEIVSAVNALSDKIADANEKTLVDFTATGSAVNHIGITNAAAGNGPTISAAGSESDVDLNITAKGTGEVNISKVDIDSGTIDGTNVTVGSSKTLDVSAGTFTTSASQNQVIVSAGGTLSGGNTLNVSAGTFTTSTAQKTSILAGGTYPAGHVLQVKTFSDQENNTMTSSYVNYYEKSITLISGSSDVVINFGFVYQVAATNGFGVRFYRDTSATVTTSDTLVFDQNTSNGNPYTVYYSGSGQVNGTFSGLFQNTLSGFSAGDTLYYGMFLRQYHSGGTVYIPPPATVEDGFIRMQLIEVQK